MKSAENILKNMTKIVGDTSFVEGYTEKKIGDKIIGKSANVENVEKYIEKVKTKSNASIETLAKKVESSVKPRKSRK